MSRSVVEGLILAVRTVVQHIDSCERLRREGADEFSQARARRDLAESARLATETADLSEKLHASALGAVAAQVARIAAPVSSLTATDQPDPPEEPPPSAA